MLRFNYVLLFSTVIFAILMKKISVMVVYNDIFLTTTHVLLSRFSRKHLSNCFPLHIIVCVVGVKIKYSGPSAALGS